LGTVDENAQQELTRIPIGRMGTVTDIAKGIVFLASDDAAFRPAPASSSTAAPPRSNPRRLAVGAKGNRTPDLSYVVGALCH
jgi:hypothetical protein